MRTVSLSDPMPARQDDVARLRVLLKALQGLATAELLPSNTLEHFSRVLSADLISVARSSLRL